MNSRPARASSMRKITCVPKYGAGLGLRTVAWISCRSSVVVRVEILSTTDSLMGIATLSDFVEKFFKRAADALEPSCLGYRQIRTGDVPGLGRDLVFDDPVFDLRAVNPRIPLAIAQQNI